MGTHPIFESDFDCLTEKMSAKQSNISFLEHQDRQLANLALKTEGRGFAMELQMEQTFCKQRPRVPGRNMRTLGAEILSGRHGEITLEDYIGETEGVESLHTFQYPI